METPLSGFTPAPDCIRDDIDPLAAIVFGVVWRFTQLDRRQCDATVETIASRAGLGTTATRDRLRLLTDRGWITSEVQPGHPTVYRDAGRWVLRIVGEDTTATRGVGGGQREALGGATPNVGGGQRQTLAKERKNSRKNYVLDSVGVTSERGDDTPSAGGMPPNEDASAIRRAARHTLATVIAEDVGAPAGSAVRRDGTIGAQYGRLIGDLCEAAGGYDGAFMAWDAFKSSISPAEWERFGSIQTIAPRFNRWRANGGARVLTEIRADVERAERVRAARAG